MPWARSTAPGRSRANQRLVRSRRCPREWSQRAGERREHRLIVAYDQEMPLFRRPTAFAVPLALFMAAAASVGCTQEPTKTASGVLLPHVTRWDAEGPGPHPAIVLLHGGAGPKLIENEPDYSRYPEALAAHGFTVFMPYYLERGGDEVQTVKDTLDWVAAQPDVIPSRIGVVGLSRGAFVGVSTAGTDPRVAALVEFYGGVRHDQAARFTRMPPTLILHGDADPVVPVEHARELQRLLDGRKTLYEIRIYVGQEHGFNGVDGEDSVTRMVTFLGEHL